MSVYDKLKKLNISLPQVSAPLATYIPFVRSQNLIFVSGHIAKREGKPWIGQLGSHLTTAQGRQAARGVAIDLIGTLHGAVENLDQVSRIVKLTILVNSSADFTEQNLVANGASELLAELFGDTGAPSLCALGVAQVPLGSCLEIDLVAEIGMRPPKLPKLGMLRIEK